MVMGCRASIHKRYRATQTSAVRIPYSIHVCDTVSDPYCGGFGSSKLDYN